MNTKIADIDKNVLAQAIARQEGFTGQISYGQEAE
jgi:hypothetical protein